MFSFELSVAEVIDQFLTSRYRMEHFDEIVDRSQKEYDELYAKMLEGTLVGSEHADALFSAYDRWQTLVSERDILPDLHLMYERELVSRLGFLKDGHALVHRHEVQPNNIGEDEPLMARLVVDKHRNVDVVLIEPVSVS